MNTALLLMAQYGGKAIPIDDVCRDYGVDISKRQVVRLISEGLEAFAAEDRDVLRAGLATAPWITVDDTSARHAHQDGYTTQTGDYRFTAFRTGRSKSRETRPFPCESANVGGQPLDRG
jgi:hypothetical protein